MALQSIGGLRGPQSLLLSSLNRSQVRLTALLEQIATGDRIIRAGNDPSGLIISEQLRSQVSGLEAAGRSVSFSRGVLGLAEGALSSAQSGIERLQSLSIQAANAGFLDPSVRGALQGAIDQTIAGIDRDLSSARFGSQSLLANAAFRTTQDTAGVLSNVAFTSTPTPVPSSGINVNVTVNSVGTAAQSTLTGVSGPTQFTLAGASGSININFGGSTSAELTSAINQVSSQTGITATDLGGGSVQLNSAGAGSNQFVSVQNVTGTGFTGGAGINTGTNASVTVNGTLAQAQGNTVSFNNNGLSGSFSVDPATVAGTSTSLTITGGGITIPTDANGGTITVGIPVFSGGSLGASSGLGGLASLTTGGSASLASGDLSSQLAILSAAGNELSAARVQVGLLDNTLGSIGDNISNQLFSSQNAFADIRGVDIASAIVGMTREKLQQQVQVSLLRSANINSANLLKLLGG